MTISVGPQCLMTIADLQVNAIECFGPMDKGSYDEFEGWMSTVARRKGVERPIMAIALQLKQVANAARLEKPYAIIRGEWEVFKQEATIMGENMPKVFIIDGSKFVLPI